MSVDIVSSAGNELAAAQRKEFQAAFLSVAPAMFFGEPRPDDHCGGASGCSARFRWIQLCHLDRYRLSVDSNHCFADLLFNAVIDRVNTDSDEVMTASVSLIVNQGAPLQVLHVSEITQQLKRVDGCWTIARRSVKT